MQAIPRVPSSLHSLIIAVFVLLVFVSFAVALPWWRAFFLRDARAAPCSRQPAHGGGAWGRAQPRQRSRPWWAGATNHAPSWET